MKLIPLILLCLPLPLMPGVACAADQAAAGEHAFITVRELMRLEGEQALVAARQRRGQAAGGRPAIQAEAEGGASGRADMLRLIGIYGVGKRLFAEVRSGSRAWVFMNGQSLPVGHTAGAEPYRLREVAGACVRLEHQETETVLCLPRGGRQ